MKNNNKPLEDEVKEMWDKIHEYPKNWMYNIFIEAEKLEKAGEKMEARKMYKWVSDKCETGLIELKKHKRYSPEYAADLCKLEAFMYFGLAYASDYKDLQREYIEKAIENYKWYKQNERVACAVP
jgi:hypothetical protein